MTPHPTRVTLIMIDCPIQQCYPLHRPDGKQGPSKAWKPRPGWPSLPWPCPLLSELAAGEFHPPSAYRTHLPTPQPAVPPPWGCVGLHLVPVLGERTWGLMGPSRQLELNQPAQGTPTGSEHCSEPSSGDGAAALPILSLGACQGTGEGGGHTYKAGALAPCSVQLLAGLRGIQMTAGSVAEIEVMGSWRPPLSCFS